ncbi:hypothetical protein AL072_21195 [Azospirillum thiophilum]|uniref:Uncharacterized protein n=1 Tax=Azospirillum thiophilum TaxID=528244 RepID=A0AAC8W250_9PROT|nr:hypothetical protein AL072_21195 [Azospirillum thiophilum]
MVPPVQPATEPTSTIRAPPRVRMPGRKARANCIGASRLTWMISWKDSSHSSASQSSKAMAPAFSTSPSTPPTVSASASMAPRSRTSQTCAVTLGAVAPAPAGASSAARAEQSRMSVSTSSAPSLAQALAVAEPMPPAAPVMSTRLPVRSNGVEPLEVGPLEVGPFGIVMAFLSLLFSRSFAQGAGHASGVGHSAAPAGLARLAAGWGALRPRLVPGCPLVRERRLWKTARRVRRCAGCRAMA